MKYEDSENINADSLNRVVFNSHEIKRRASFLGQPVYFSILIQDYPKKVLTRVHRKLAFVCILAFLPEMFPEKVFTFSMHNISDLKSIKVIKISC